MADVDGGLVLEHLRSIQERLGRLENGQREIMTELRAHKTKLGSLVQQDALQDGRIADLALRLDRVEKRLELRDSNDGN